jgi:transcriptional regulator NrdR family protein
MQCPLCQAWTDVRASRKGRRSRECANGHRFNTVEVTADLAEFLQLQARLNKARRVLREKGYLR